VALVSAAAAVLLLLAGGWMWMELSDLTRQRLAAEGDLRKLKAEVDKERTVGRQKQLAEWAQWQDEHVPWLQEMARLAEKLPAASAVKLKALSASFSPSKGGTLVVDGVASSYEAIGELDRALADDAHRVEGGAAQRDESDKKYNWKFKQELTVNSPDDEARTAGTVSPRASRAPRGTTTPRRSTRATLGTSSDGL
jgi:hypothetical protein